MKLQLMNKVCLMAAVFSVAFYSHSFGQAGTLDSTFGVNGKAIQAIDSSQGFNVIALQQNGKIIGGGKIIRNGRNNFVIARFDTDGTIDSTFGTNGLTIIPIGTVDDGIYCIAIQPDDKIVMGGYSYINSVPYCAVARCNADGTIDSSFDNDGIKIFDTNIPNSIAVRSGDGKIILASDGGSPSATILTRLNPDGSLDLTFGIQGQAVSPNSGQSRALAIMKLQSDNKIVGVTSTSISLNFALAIVRFKANGFPDSTFGTNGVVITQYTIPGLDAGLIIQPDGKIVVTTSYQNETVLLRLNADGTYDNNFGTGGKVVFNFGNYMDVANSAALQQDNKIVILGQSKATQLSTKSNFVISRFNADGTLDNEFGSNGFTITNFDSSNTDIGLEVFALPDGKLLAAGISIFPFPSFSNTVFARYNSCGISITNQPADQTKGLGATATFAVSSTTSSADYQWQTNNASGWANLSDGGQYSGTQTHSLHVAGLTLANDQQRFRVIALSGACSDTSASALLTVDTSLGISEIDRAAGFRVYPNPVNDQLTITAKSLSDNITAIRVTDLLGKTIIHWKITGKTTTTLSTKRWSAGIYIIEVSLNGKAPQVIKVVKE